jgi:hypothetical protein
MYLVNTNLGRASQRRPYVRRRRALGDGFLDVVGNAASSIQDLVLNAYHGNITSDQGAQTAADTCNSQYSQAGYQNLPPDQLAQMKAACLQGNLKLVRAVVNTQPAPGYADQQGLLPSLPTQSPTFWLLVAGAALLGVIVVAKVL